MKSDGQRAQKAEAPAVVTLGELFDRYEREMPPGALEANSWATVRIHVRHLLRLLRLLGRRSPVIALTTDTLQRYINARPREVYRGKPISGKTAKKEVVTFRAVWNWGKPRGLVAGDAPTKGLRYEKEEERGGLLTWGEIERRIARGGLTESRRTGCGSRFS